MTLSNTAKSIDAGDEHMIAMNADDLRQIMASAYQQGCEDTHNNYQEDREPDFKEASLDYASDIMNRVSAKAPTTALRGDSPDSAPSTDSAAELRSAGHVTVKREHLEIVLRDRPPWVCQSPPMPYAEQMKLWKDALFAMDDALNGRKPSERVSEPSPSSSGGEA